MLTWYSWYNIAQVKTLSNIVQETPGHITQKKICAILP